MATSSLELASFRQGATFRRRLTVVNVDLSAKDLTGATARWALYLDDGTETIAVGPYELGSGIAVDGAATGGKLLVTMTDVVTEPLDGSYRQEWRIVDSVGDVQKYVGKVLALRAYLEAAA